MGFGHVPTPAKHVLLVHMNMLQGLKIHQGLKIRHIFTHKYLKCVPVNVEPRWPRCLGDRLTIQRSLVRISEHHEKESFLKSDSFRKLPQLSKRTCDYFTKTNTRSSNSAVSVYHDSRISHESNYSLDYWSSILLLSTNKMLCIYPMFYRAILQQWKWMQLNEHWTIRVHKALPAKVIHEIFKVWLPNISVQVEFNWYQTSVCWNISILHYRGTNHPKSRVQVHP
jgi:hypothetical protein